METTIIGQGYNLSANTSVADVLKKQFESKRYNKFVCLVAFASDGGVSALSRLIADAKAQGMEIRVILGIDAGGTSKEALEVVLSWGVDAYIYHTDAKNIFHPKVYLFENEDIFTLIVGSNNLTIPGLTQNVECSLLVKDIKSNPVHQEFYDYWKGILEGTDNNLYPITADLIKDLVSDRIVPSEADRAVMHDAESSKGNANDHRMKFNIVSLQPFPKGFSPKRPADKSKRMSARSPQKDIAMQSEGEEVLIAEIGNGDRWKQVNFPLRIFEDFFGAKRGDKAYSVKLRNITSDGSLSEERKARSVTVKSGNYRFELKCEETKGKYPGDDNRPIGIYVKLGDATFAYHVLLSGHKKYEAVKAFLYSRSKRPKRELKRAIIHAKELQAIYPELHI